MRTPGLLRSFGHVFGCGLANELLDRIFPPPPSFAERLLKGFSEAALAMAPYIVERLAPKEPPPPEAAPATPQPSAPEDEAVQVAISKEWPREAPPNVDVLRMDLASLRKALGECRPQSDPQSTLIGRAVKFIRAADKLGSEGALFKAVGDRRRDDETTVQAATRLLADADAYIAKQAEQIRGLILDNEFKVNCGELATVLTADHAAAIGLPNYAMQPVAMVVNDGCWYVRVGATLYPMCKASPGRQAPALSTAELADYLLHALKRKANDAAPVLIGHPLPGGLVGGPVKFDEEKTDSKIGDGQQCARCHARAGEQCEFDCPNHFARVPVVGRETTVPVDVAVAQARQSAERSVIGGPVKIDETAMAQNASGGVT